MDMAPNVVPEVPSGPSRPAQNLRNPLPLSATQEQEVRKLYYARVRSRCADEIKGKSAAPYSLRLERRCGVDYTVATPSTADQRD